MSGTTKRRTIDGHRGPFEVNTFACGCVIASEFPNGSGVKTIEYCAQHAAAPRLHSALSHVVGFLELLGHADLVCAIEGRAALLEATGEDGPAIQSPTPQQGEKKGTQGGQ